VLPKITKCGHIYCWLCILQYLSYRINADFFLRLEKPKCPLCDEYMLSEDLKSVVITHIDLLQSGDPISLKLKRRNKMNYLVFNAEDYSIEEEFVRIRRIFFEEIRDISEAEKIQLYNLLMEYTKEGDKPMVECCERVFSLN
jgi:hypothetical protein